MGSGHGGTDGLGERLPRGSHGLPPEFVTRSQRERLFTGMARVMARSGYAATTVDLIAAESGVSRKALYTHFSGKEELLLKAHQAIVERIAAGAGPSVAEQQDWREGLRALLDWGLELFAREPELANLSLVEVSAATPASRRLHYETVDHLREMIEQATAGSPQSLPKAAIEGMIDGTLHLIARAADEGDATDLLALRRELMAWFLAVFEGPKAAESELRRES
jgi:AcrR family transcriptional regulator